MLEMHQPSWFFGWGQGRLGTSSEPNRTIYKARGKLVSWNLSGRRVFLCLMVKKQVELFANKYTWRAVTYKPKFLASLEN